MINNVAELIDAIVNGTAEGVFLCSSRNAALWFLSGNYATSSRQYSGVDLSNLVDKFDTGMVFLGYGSTWFGDMSEDDIYNCRRVRRWLGSYGPGWPGEFVCVQDVIKIKSEQTPG